MRNPNDLDQYQPVRSRIRTGTRDNDDDNVVNDSRVLQSLNTSVPQHQVQVDDSDPRVGRVPTDLNDDTNDDPVRSGDLRADVT